MLSVLDGIRVLQRRQKSPVQGLVFAVAGYKISPTRGSGTRMRQGWRPRVHSWPTQPPAGSRAPEGPVPSPERTLRVHGARVRCRPRADAEHRRALDR